MPDLLLSDIERTVIRNLLRLSSERDAGEMDITRRGKAERAALDRQYEERRQRLQQQFEADARSNESEHQAAREEIEARFAENAAKDEKKYRSQRFKINEQADHDELQTKKAWEEARWTAETVYEAKEPQPKEEFEKTAKALRSRAATFQAIESEALEILRACRIRPRPHTPPTISMASAEAGEAARVLEDEGAKASQRLQALRDAFLPHLFEGARPFMAGLLPFAAAAGLVGWLTEWKFNNWLPHAGIAALAAAVVMLLLLHAQARKKARRLHAELLDALASARAARERCLVLASEKRAREEAELLRQRDDDLARARETHEPRLEKIRTVRRQLLKELDEWFARRKAELKAAHDADLAECDARHATRRAEILSTYESDRAALEAESTARRAAIDERESREWTTLESQWRSGMAEVHRLVARLREFDERHDRAWNAAAFADWSPPGTFAPAVRFGALDVNLAAIPGGIPRDERLLDVGPLRFEMPAILDFPRRSSMLIEAHDGTRDQAVATLQNVMARLLTTFPPGKVRFTIIDPVGLGQNFAGFMHLADYEEAFVADRIWTEPRHIEQRLTDLTEHMENVIQKYLRNDFETITDYNEHAGEIAEPFRFLVIANFPVNFTETAARRLVSIIESGPRCGVYTLIAVDSRQPLPQGVSMDDLRKGGVVLESRDGRLTMRDDDLARLPLTLDPAPTPDFLTDMLHTVGTHAKHASRVEVPFEHVVPAREDYWSGSSDREVAVPLGRAGATKLQPMVLGRGIAQHALIAGKTGSGKSTLLHVIITNLALHYRPDEVEFYLVDFKKGVEFKTYATHGLPHARAVAIESDREFGLSVLQRVDAELKRRGEIFRKLGVQDLAGYRRTGHSARIPRTLLIIDEFQEFFVEDDKLAQDAGLLLDRLVRQGRAFGIHVILGSQTLAGAYSLARSTMGQMAVRVALQCSEADAMLILGDDNTAARLLSRPGEAIYNDQGGLLEGNSPFQIVWLPEEVRDRYLREVSELATREGYEPPEPMIVFEGNIPADIRRNAVLHRVLASGPPAQPPAAGVAWMGDAIAIKDPTAAVFRRQSGCNLLIVGQREEFAVAIQEAGIVGLAAQTPADRGVFYVLDGLSSDSPHAGSFERLARHLPHDLRVVGWHDVEGAMAEIGEELDRRRAAGRPDPAPIYLFICGLHRFRMLRQAEEFGFMSSSSGNEGKLRGPDKIFGELLRDGPPLGMHVIAWCDTPNNLSRVLDRGAMREFDLRVLFQMSTTDSSNLIDTPIAGALGNTRAILHSEDLGLLEKFRPYATLDEHWVAEIGKQLRGQPANVQ